MSRTILGYLCGVLLAGSALAGRPERVLWDDKPAVKWDKQAYPLGNGRMGCMVYGGVPNETIQFNVDSLWTGDKNLGGKYRSPGMGTYKGFSSLYVKLDQDAEVEEYRRELDLETALSTVTYRAGNTRYQYETFCSFPDEVIVSRWTADAKGAYSGSLSMQQFFRRGWDLARIVNVTAKGNRLIASGTLENGLAYEAQVLIMTEGGKVSMETKPGRKKDEPVIQMLVFKNCDALTLILAAGTSYVLDPSVDFLGPHPHKTVVQQLKAAAKKPYKTLRDDAIASYQSLYKRVELDLGSTPKKQLNLPLNQRLDLVQAEKIHLTKKYGVMKKDKDGNWVKDLDYDPANPKPYTHKDPDLEELLFQYGRYLLIGSSRPGHGALPANLQGLWCNTEFPAWCSDYHSNINLQMNYWGAETANLAECHTPLLDMLMKHRAIFREGTLHDSDRFGPEVRGFAIRTSHNPFGGMGYSWNLTGNAWYARHFWEHYEFGQDKKYLKKTAYPFLKEVCEFWVDHLKELPDGRLVAPKGWSPEHGPRVDGVAYDQQLLWDLFSNYVKAARILGVDKDFAEQVDAKRAKLVGPKIGSWGQLMEWMTEMPKLEKSHHRHTSHLYAVYPGTQISAVQTPELAEAAQVSLTARGETGDSRKEWAWCWRTALWARLKNPEKAHRMISSFLMYNMLDNLIGTHPPLQLDGSFGITGSMCEMLLQSHAESIDLLPALPTAWSTGSVKGLRARGGCEVDLDWAEGTLRKVVIHAKTSGECIVRYGEETRSLKTVAGQSYTLNANLK